MSYIPANIKITDVRFFRAGATYVPRIGPGIYLAL